MRKAVESANEKMEHYRQLYNDCNRNKTNMEIALGSQMETLVQEKHASQARVSDLEDRVAALQVEKEVLVDGLRRTEGAKQTHSPFPFELLPAQFQTALFYVEAHRAPPAMSQFRS